MDLEDHAQLIFAQMLSAALAKGQPIGTGDYKGYAEMAWLAAEAFNQVLVKKRLGPQI